MNFTNIGRLQNKSIINKFKIKISTLDKKINLFENFIIVKIKNKFKIYDRICDHAGGKIISKKNEFVCPLHSWRFDPEKGKYSNGVKKKEILNYVSEGNLIFEVKKQIPKIKKIRIDEEVKIRFINHAFVIISGKNFKFAMDPWAIGPAFNSGWWLRLKTKNDWIKHINNCDFIYTSHNHPDHLNKYTLAHVRKDMQFIVPKYTTDSTGIFIETLGFKNILRLDFKDQFQFKDTNLIISILKSGDFRDDSGIYFSIGNFSCLFDVDTNNINFNNLPKVDLYGSSFAGGASGYPLIFSNYNEKEKKRIINTNKVSLRIFKEKNLKSIKPKYFFPYAGFFSESLNRDSYIYKNNKKNKIEDYEKICKNLKSKILNVEKFDEFYFLGKKLTNEKKLKIKYYKDKSNLFYLNKIKKNFKDIDDEYIINYFKNSKYKDNLLLSIDLTNENFKSIYINYLIDFSNDKINIYVNSILNIESILKNKNLRFLNIKCRKESFLNTIYNKEAWEDLTIGFQCLIYRKPNIYNVDFWYHFSNVYVTKKNVRSIINCNNCDKINQLLDSSKL